MKTLLFSILLLSASLSVAQTLTPVSRDNFDTAATAPLSVRRLWKSGGDNASGATFLRTNGANSVEANGVTSGTYAFAYWDSLVTTPTMMQYTIADLGGSNPSGTKTVDLNSYIPASSYTNWKGYRIQWIKWDANGDRINLQRYSGGINREMTYLPNGVSDPNSGAVSLYRQLAVNDTIQLWEYGNDWHAMVVKGVNHVVDSIAAFDTTYHTTSGRWGIRAWYSLDGGVVQKIDNSLINKVTPPAPVDITAPVIVSITESPSGPDSSQALTFTFHATDDFKLDTLRIRFGSQESGLYSDSAVAKAGTPGRKDTTIFLSLPKHAPGAYIYQADVIDSARHRTISQVFVFTITTKKVASYSLYDPFDSLPTPSIGGFRRQFKKIYTQSDPSASIQINSDSTASPINSAGAVSGGTTTYGGVFIDSNLTGRTVVGFIVKNRGTAGSVINLYTRMNGDSLPTADGYKLQITNENPVTGDDVELLNWTDGAINPNGGQLVVKKIVIQVGDTVYFRSDNVLNRVSGFFTGIHGGVPFKDSVEWLNGIYNPTTYHVWLQGTVVSTGVTPWKIDNLYLDVLQPPPALPVDPIDDVPPVIYVKGVAPVAPDTSTRDSIVINVRDEIANAQWSVIPSTGLDSAHIGVYGSAGTALITQKGVKYGNGATSFDSLLSTVGQKYAGGDYIARIWVRDKAGNVTTDSLVMKVTGGRSIWITAYYPNWMFRQASSPTWYAVPPWDMKFTGMTHIVQFGNLNLQSTAPYLTAMTSDSLEWAFGTQSNGEATRTFYRDSLVAIAHRQGAKVLFCIIQTSSGTILNTITSDSATTDIFAQYVAGYVQRHNYDGVDVNWETNVGSKIQTSLLFRRLRARLGTTATITVSPLSGGWGNYDGTVCNQYVNQINPQEYDLSDAYNGCISHNGNWPINPIHQGDTSTCSGTNQQAYDSRGPLQWVANGFSSSIMGAGIASFGRVYYPSKVIGGNWNTKEDVCNYFTGAQLLNGSNGGTLIQDGVRLCDYIFGTAPTAFSYRNATIPAGSDYFFTYQTPHAIPAQIDWIKTHNLGGVMVYALDGDVDKSLGYGLTNPIMNAIIASAANTLAPAPTAPVLNTPSGNVNAEPIVGLSLTWNISATATSYRIQIGKDSLFSSGLIVIDQAGLTSTAFLAGSPPNSALQYSTTYYWRVDATNATGEGAFSAKATFKTQADPTLPTHTPPVPLLVSPSDLSTNQPLSLTFTVAKSTSGDTVSFFGVEVSQGNTFAVLIKNDTTIAAPNVQTSITGLSSATTYFWRARAKNIVGWSAYTTARSFTTVGAPPPPTDTTSTIPSGVTVIYDPIYGLRLGVIDRIIIKQTDPATWKAPKDSGTTAFFGNGYMKYGATTPTNLDNAASGAPPSGSAIVSAIDALGNPTYASPATFNAGITVRSGGSTLATMNGNGISVQNLSVTGASSFTGGITTLGGGLATNYITTTASLFNSITFDVPNLNFSNSGAHTFSILDAAIGAGNALTIAGQRGASNQNGGDLNLNGGAGNLGGNGANVVISGGAAGGGGGSAKGKILMPNGGLQYTDGNQAAGRVMTSDANGNIALQAIPGASVSMKDMYSFREDWTEVGLSSYNIPAGQTTNSFDRKWVFWGGGAAGVGTNLVQMDPIVSLVSDSADIGIIRDTVLGTTSTPGTSRYIIGYPTGVGSNFNRGLYMRKFGLTMNELFMMPQTNNGMDSLGRVWGFVGSVNDEDFSITNTSKFALVWKNKGAAGTQDSIYLQVSGGSGTTSRGLIKPTAAQKITSSIWIDANGFNGTVNGVTKTIPWSDANIPIASVGLVVREINVYAATLQAAPNGKSFHSYYFEFYLPTSR